MRISDWSSDVCSSDLLSVILGLLLIGTLYPLLTEAFGHKVSVGAPYFDRIAGPIALALMIVMVLGPLTRWRRDRMREVARRVAVPAVVAGLVFLALAALAWGRIGILPFLGLGIALAVAVVRKRGG